MGVTISLGGMLRLALACLLALHVQLGEAAAASHDVRQTALARIFAGEYLQLLRRRARLDQEDPLMSSNAALIRHDWASIERLTKEVLPSINAGDFRFSLQKSGLVCLAAGGMRIPLLAPDETWDAEFAALVEMRSGGNPFAAKLLSQFRPAKKKTSGKRQKKPASVLMYEGFADNKAGWYETDHSKALVYVAEGRYYFEQRRTIGTWMAWKSIPGFSTETDFRIDVDVRHLSGVTDSGFGVVWGEDIDNFFHFMINAEGAFQFSKSRAGRFVSLLEWRSNRVIAAGESWNTLSIVREGGYISFLVNETEVTRQSFEPFGGDNIGFRVDKNQAVEFDNFLVRTLP